MKLEKNNGTRVAIFVTIGYFDQQKGRKTTYICTRKRWNSHDFLALKGTIISGTALVPVLRHFERKDPRGVNMRNIYHFIKKIYHFVKKRFFFVTNTCVCQKNFVTLQRVCVET